MGLFSRNESATGSGRRSSQSSEAQAGELRARARRRLVGALALVLAAVIIVPMLFDDPVPPEQPSTPVVIPAIVPPAAPDTTIALAPEPADPASSDNETLPLDTPLAVDPASDVNAAASATTPSTAPDTGTTGERSPEQVEAPAKPAPAAKPKPTEKPASKSEAKPASERTDDGSVAIALLEGRTPAKKAPAPAAKGNFTLQIAAYGNDQDAQTRRERLIASGVTNAYVESAVSGGKSTYRLRVGPFPTRDAAQAAQARLRALGYDNGFISTK
ncbi:SPOR domain-containing protein [Pollutimonas nitritireducens]|uniref:SPOR domain-containing protein n=1 Tax=Pollutimonas nitritireducens TaxID=2045209 RepID=A0A2N4UGL7_9BURK|nr:SPOR domain-containing protein [Pollutimonas nitritireducens]PLC54157.1 SPOR domain-containing protein [Pollutimonas nitritireducens]